MRSGRFPISGSARAAAGRRSHGACERCGLEWPWLLFVYVVDPSRPARGENLRVLCGPCSEGDEAPFAPLVGERTLRARMQDSNNRRTGAVKLTAARRRKLIEARGGCCEICGVAASERQLEVHHRTAVLRGGDDSESNLLVLCFACHHHVQPCATGCGRWAKKPAKLCRHCRMREDLENLYPDRTWDEIKSRLPSLVLTWPPGYEPRSSRPSGPASP